MTIHRIYVTVSTYKVFVIVFPIELIVNNICFCHISDFLLTGVITILIWHGITIFIKNVGFTVSREFLHTP